tara:strand:+ start:10 stop:315 length:306 start_codon:yes stop_codon:yes gene_type:complete
MGMIQNINISDRLTDCLDNDWHDLVDHLDGITQALMDIPEAGQTMRTALIEWCAEVDTRTQTAAAVEGGVQGGECDSEASDPTQNTASFLKGCDDKFGCES